MATRRHTSEPRLLTSGPGRLAQALGLSGDHDGLPLDRPPFEIYAREDVEVERGTRIGVTKAADKPWRYGEVGSRYVSRPIRQ
jgi:DNA-3-methyladenine glycosylase